MKIRIFQGGEVDHLIPTKNIKYDRTELRKYILKIQERIDNRKNVFEERVLLRRRPEGVYIVDGHFRLAAYYVMGYRLLLTSDYTWETNENI